MQPPPSLREEVVRRYLAGEQVVNMAAELGVSTTSIYWNLDKAGVRRRQSSGPRKINPNLAALISADYLAGGSTRSIAAARGIGTKTVLRSLHQSGTPIRRQGSAPKHFGDIRKKSELLVDKHRDEIVHRYSVNGESQQAIADSLGISQAIVSRVVIRAGASRSVKNREAHHAWKGGRRLGAGGYVAVMPELDDRIGLAMRGHSDYVLEHRLVMAHSLGRPLAKEETVHHINGDRQDNRIENLQLRQGKHGKGVVARCADCGSHNIITTPITEVGEMRATVRPPR